MFKTTSPSKRSKAPRPLRGPKPWDRAIVSTGVQLLAVGAILLGGAFALRAVKSPADRDPELSAIIDRTTIAAVSATERYVLDRSAKISAPAPADTATHQSLPSTTEEPLSAVDLLPPLARADFAEPVVTTAPIATVEAPAPTVEEPAAQIDTIVVDPALHEFVPAAAAAPVGIASVADDHAQAAPPALLVSERPIASSIALAARIPRAEAPAKARPKARLEDAEPKKRRAIASDVERNTKNLHRVADTHDMPARRRDYAMPARAGICAGGPARWIGTKIYWGHRC